jgi:hypothetical protein
MTLDALVALVAFDALGSFDALEEYQFTGQSSHLVEFGGAKRPASHASQPLPGKAAYVSAGQAVQDSLPISEKEPGGHGKHGMPSSAKKFSGQFLQDSWPPAPSSESWAVPGGHLVQRCSFSLTESFAAEKKY